MEVQYRKEMANHFGPEACVTRREVWGEALTGNPAGQPLSREINIPGCRRGSSHRKAIWGKATIASHAPIPRGRRPCACREASCTEAGRSRRCLTQQSQAGQGENDRQAAVARFQRLHIHLPSDDVLRRIGNSPPKIIDGSVPRFY